MQGVRSQECGSTHEALVMSLSQVFMVVIIWSLGGSSGVFAHRKNSLFLLGSVKALGGFSRQQLGGAVP